MAKRKLAEHILPSIPSYKKTSRAWPLFRSAITEDDPRLTWALKNNENYEQFDVVQLSYRHWDWREHRISPIIRNQGEWNACVSFACVGMIEARRKIAGLPYEQLSPGFVHNCLMGIWDKNTVTNCSHVLEACASDGISIGSASNIPIANSACSGTNRIHILGYRWISTQFEIYNDLAENGPSVVTMNIDRGFIEHTGWEPYNLSSTAIDTQLHAVMIIGYEIDENYIIIQNSFGLDWGVGGIGRVRIGSGEVVTGRSAISALVR